MIPSESERATIKLLQESQHLENVAHRLLQIQRECFNSIENGDFPATEALLTQKQALIDEVQGIHELGREYRRISEHNRSSQITTIEAVLRKLDGLVQEIRQMEQETINIIRERHRTTATQLQELMRNHRTANTYKQPKQSSTYPKIDISG